MTSRRYDVFDYNAALDRARASLKALKKGSPRVFRHDRRPEDLEPVQWEIERIKAALQELYTSLQREVLAEEEERMAAEKAREVSPEEAAKAHEILARGLRLGPVDQSNTPD